jgi:hypothetical protein
VNRDGVQGGMKEEGDRGKIHTIIGLTERGSVIFMTVIFMTVIFMTESLRGEFRCSKSLRQQFSKFCISR